MGLDFHGPKPELTGFLFTTLRAVTMLPPITGVQQPGFHANRLGCKLPETT
jgi:hypothetical protein